MICATVKSMCATVKSNLLQSIRFALEVLRERWNRLIVVKVLDEIRQRTDPLNAALDRGLRELQMKARASWQNSR